jgi:hypothetical protein
VAKNKRTPNARTKEITGKYDMRDPLENYIPLPDETIELLANMDNNQVAAKLTESYIKSIPDILLSATDMAKEIRHLRQQLQTNK